MTDYSKMIKIALYGALIVVALLLWNAWQREYGTQAPQQTQASRTVTQANISSNVPTSTNTAASSPTSNVPSIPSSMQASSTHTSVTDATSNSTLSADRLIHVKTDVLNVVIDKLGGNIVAVGLPKYPETLGTPNQAFKLLNDQKPHYYVAESGLTGTQGPDTPKGQVTYTSAQNNYTLAEGQNELTIKLSWRNAEGLTVDKEYIFKRDRYAVTLQYQIHNQTANAWQGHLYTQLLRTEPKKSSSFLHYALFTGAAISSPDKHYDKLSFSNLASSPVNQTVTGGWAAMVQHYFLGAWIPNANQAYHYYSSGNDGVYKVGMIGPVLSVQSGATASTSATLYTGPAIAKRLDTVAPHLSMTIDYGWLWFISVFLFWVMKHVHDLLGNWGWSIIFVTFLIKLAFYWLSAKSYRSMAHMRRLQPKMSQLRERFGDDRQGFSKAMMELYRKEKCNPLSGCLPILVQIPFFIAFYYMIIESVELRQAPFMFWIHDLSAPDPYFILPVLMGLTMFLQQRLNPPAPDPMQQKVMMFLPIVFTFFFLYFPAGLVLYWITNNLLSITQQWFIIKRVNKTESAQEAKKRHYKPTKKKS